MTRKEELCQAELVVLVEKLHTEHYKMTADVIKAVMANDFESARKYLDQLDDHVSDPHDTPLDS